MIGEKRSNRINEIWAERIHVQNSKVVYIKVRFQQVVTCAKYVAKTCSRNKILVSAYIL